MKEMDCFVFTTLTYLVIRLFLSPPCQNLTMYLKFESILNVTNHHRLLGAYAL